MPKFHPICWCGNYVEMHSLHKVLADSPGTLWKLYISTKFPGQEIM